MIGWPDFSATAETEAGRVRADAAAQLRAADEARVAAEEQRRKAEVSEARRVLAVTDLEVCTTRCPEVP